MASTAGQTLEALAATVICLFSILGNASLFLIIYRNKSLHRISNYYTLSLATADLLVTSVSGPIMVYTIIKGEWMFDKTTCVAFGFITIVTFIASVANLVLIAVNRYFYINHWCKYKYYFAPRRAALYCAMVWLFSLGLSSPPLWGWGEYAYIPDQSFCFVKWSSNLYYMYFTVIICFFGPLTTMAFCYYKILSFTRSLNQNLQKSTQISQPNSLRDAAPGNPGKGSAHDVRVSPEETKITNTLLIVVSCFVFSWAAFALTIFLNVYLAHRLPREVNMWSLILGYVNSMSNPVIYGMRNRKINKGYKELLVKCFPCLKRRQRRTISEIRNLSTNSSISKPWTGQNGGVELHEIKTNHHPDGENPDGEMSQHDNRVSPFEQPI